MRVRGSLDGRAHLARRRRAPRRLHRLLALHDAPLQHFLRTEGQHVPAQQQQARTRHERAHERRGACARLLGLLCELRAIVECGEGGEDEEAGEERVLHHGGGGGALERALNEVLPRRRLKVRLEVRLEVGVRASVRALGVTASDGLRVGSAFGTACALGPGPGARACRVGLGDGILDWCSPGGEAA